MRVLCILLISTSLFITASAQTVKQVDVATFEQGTRKPEIQVLDVRTLGEYNSGHLPKAFLADWINQPQFAERVSHLDKNKEIYVYCLSGARSAAAADWLQKQGFTNVVALKGGINSWKQAGKPVENNRVEKQLTSEEYQSRVKTPGYVLVDIGAEWCPPCKKMEPVLDSLQKEMGDKLKTFKIDAGVHTTLLQTLKVEALPVFIIYKDGKQVWRKDGLSSLQELKSILQTP